MEGERTRTRRGRSVSRGEGETGRFVGSGSIRETRDRRRAAAARPGARIGAAIAGDRGLDPAIAGGTRGGRRWRGSAGGDRARGGAGWAGGAARVRPRGFGDAPGSPGGWIVDGGAPRTWGTAWAGAAPGARLSACASGWSCRRCRDPGDEGGATRGRGQRASGARNFLPPKIPRRRGERWGVARRRDVRDEEARRTRKRILAFFCHRPSVARMS